MSPEVFTMNIQHTPKRPAAQRATEQPTTQRRLRQLVLLTTAAALSGCASWNSLHSSVSSFGDWPQGRAPGRFVFERLPSQSSQPTRQAELEQLALPALQAAGFQLAGQGETPDVRVMLGAHIATSAYPTWRDPFWPAPVGMRWAGSPWMVHSWPMSSPEYRREVVLVLRSTSADAAGQPQAERSAALYEARAYTTGTTPGTDAMLGAMFRAALSDFPRAKPEPHGVAVALP